MLLSAAKAMILIALNIVLFDSKCRILEGWLATSIKTLMFLLNGYSQKEGFLILKKRLCRATFVSVCDVCLRDQRSNIQQKNNSDVAKKSQAPMWSIARHLLFSQSNNTQETSPFRSFFF